MSAPVTVTLLFDGDSPTARGVAEGLTTQVDMVVPTSGPAGAGLRVPVRWRCRLWQRGQIRPASRPAPGQLAVVVVLQCGLFDAAAAWWDAALAPLDEVPEAQLLRIHVALTSNVTPPPGFSRYQGIKLCNWTHFAGTDSPMDHDARITRLALRVIDAIRRHPRLTGRPLPVMPHCDREPVFVSHAKADGDSIAASIAAHVSHPDNDLHLDTFFDRATLETGRDWAEGLKQAAAGAAMLVLRTDAYESRPWCAEELITAKRYRRPMLLVDLTDATVARTLPYLGRLPMLRAQLDAQRAMGPATIERVLLALWREALRCDLVRIAGQAASGRHVVVLPRWPETLDAHFADIQTAQILVYPDPPLPRVEETLLCDHLDKTLRPLSEICAP